MPKVEKSVLKVILTSEGGSGHKAAAEVLQKEFIEHGDTVKVINMTKERWFSGFLGIEEIVVNIWNFAQKHGWIFIMRSLSFLEIFHNVMTFVIKNNVTSFIDQYIDDFDEIEVHNTFPVSLAAIIDSIAEYNKSNKKNIKVKYVHHLTDLPSDYSKNLDLEFSYINSENLKDVGFELVTVPPVMEEGVNFNNIDGANIERHYHEKMKKLYPKIFDDINEGEYSARLKFTNGPVRKEFFHYSENPASRDDGLYVNFEDKKEYQNLEEIVKDKKLLGNFDENLNNAPINLNCFNEKAEIISVMLGSQADIDGSISILESEKQLQNISENLKPKIVFVFCGANIENDTSCLYQKASDFAKKYNNDTFKVIPLSKQGSKTIAQLYSTADLLCIRPGGLSTMEAKIVARGKVMVYTVVDYLVKVANAMLFKSDEDLRKYYSSQDQKERLSELVVWEEGNAKFLEQNIFNKELDLSNVSYANEYSYFNTRKLSNVISNQLNPLITKENYKEAMNIIKSDHNLCISLVQFGGKIKKMSLVASMINHLDNIKTKFHEMKNYDILNDLSHDKIQGLILLIDNKVELLQEQPLNENNAFVITSCYQEILNTSNFIYNSIEQDSNEKNQDLIHELRSIIISILAQIPLINYFVKDSLEYKFIDMKSELDEIDCHVKKLMKAG